MQLHNIDLYIILSYVLVVMVVGFFISKNATKDMNSYFLGNNKMKWYMLGLSNASGMFDISGVMWTVSILFIYGLKSAWIPWLWPVWNQVFVFVYLAIWMRRSNVMTGAQWITFRFGEGPGAKLSHFIIVIFAIVSVLGFTAYSFEGIGKFCTLIFPWNMSIGYGIINITSEHSYALIICGLTALYTIKGGMYSVVATEVLQFIIMTISCIAIGYIAYGICDPVMINKLMPEGWGNMWFGWKLDLDWNQTVFASIDAKIKQDGFDMFGLLFCMMLFKGIFASVAGPVPSYDMQRILATSNPTEAAKMGAITTAVLFLPRYLMVAAFAIIAIMYLSPQISGLGDKFDFENVMPLVIQNHIPVGLKGLLLAGLLAAFMGTFSAFVNSAPAYIVNDIYKKYFNPNADDKKYIQMSIYASLGLVSIGIIFGFYASSLNQLTLWITSALYGGYAAANFLKWIWWRFSGYGYFYGMLFGLIISTIKLFFLPNIVDIYFFPVIFLFSLAGCFIGSYFCPSDDVETLKTFYKKTNPWGFWGPIKEAVMKEDPSFVPNKDFKKDAINILIGIIWQMSQVVLPIYFMLKNNTQAIMWTIILIITTYLLKKLWWDKLAAETQYTN